VLQQSEVSAEASDSSIHTMAIEKLTHKNFSLDSLKTVLK